MESLDYSQKYCIIGAGPSGITAAKNLKALGTPCDVIEREDDVGGNWYFGKAGSSIYRSTHLISSRPMTQFRDFPMPADYPDYPNHDQVLAYVRAYARHFGVYELTQFNTSVEKVERAEDGLWDVTLTGADSRQTRRYQGVIIANGHHWDPRTPDYPGHFDGLALHSHDYKDPDALRDKRVLVVGAGNSGCDIAVDSAHVARRTFHSTRRGYHYIPKYVAGIPVDQVNELSVRLRVPVPVRRLVNRGILRLTMGDPRRFGLPRPDHRLLEAHPVVNSQLFYFLGHGDITPKPDVAELCGERVRFKDGSEEAIDVIVYATGFKLSFPFIDGRHLNWQGNGPRLYLHVFHPEYDNLFMAGLIQPDSGQFWIVDIQCQAIARFIRAQGSDPARAAWFRGVKAGPQPDVRGGIKHMDTPRHTLEVEHFSYSNRLKKVAAALG